MADSSGKRDNRVGIRVGSAGSRPATRSPEPAPRIRTRQETRDSHDPLPVCAPAPTLASLETTRLRLRPLCAADHQLYLDLYTHPDTMRYIGRPLT